MCLKNTINTPRKLSSVFATVCTDFLLKAGKTCKLCHCFIGIVKMLCQNVQKPMRNIYEWNPLITAYLFDKVFALLHFIYKMNYYLHKLISWKPEVILNSMSLYYLDELMQLCLQQCLLNAIQTLSGTCLGYQCLHRPYYLVNLTLTIFWLKNE